MAGDAGKGERTIVVAQKHALVGLIGVSEVVLGIEDANRLPTLGQSLDEVAEGLVGEIRNELGHFNLGDQRKYDPRSKNEYLILGRDFRPGCNLCPMTTPSASADFCKRNP